MDINLDIPEGAVTALVGDNGAGKSTLIKTISGIWEPSHGQLLWNGKQVHLHGPKDATDLGIATVYQDLALCDNLDIVQNMFLGREELKHWQLDEIGMELAAKQTLADAKAHNVRILLPVDHVVADKPEPSARIRHIGEGEPIPADMMALDIGPKSIEMFCDEIEGARTIVWNGPMGVFEIEAFAKGTKKIAHAVADNGAAVSIVGGGDSVAAVKAAGVADKITHISTGGGASLEFLEGKKLPGVEALSNK